MLATCSPRVLASAKQTPSRAARQRSVSVRATAETSLGRINPSIKKDVEKVVDAVVVPDDLDGKPQVPYCRCWRSATFPKCNGAHVQFNKETGDNIGPLLVKGAK